jgi:beta-galactosidase
VLKAVGKRDGKVACQAEMRTAGPPAAIRLAADRDSVSTTPGDVANVTFEIVDSAGVLVPTAGDVVAFTVEGGSLLALDNASLVDHDPYRADRRHAVNGRGLAILRSDRPGSMRVSAAAAGLRGASITLRVVRAVAPPSIPGAASGGAR